MRKESVLFLLVLTQKFLVGENASDPEFLRWPNMMYALTVGGRARFGGNFEAGIEVTGLVSRNIILICTPRCISFCSKKVHLVLKQTYYVILLG